jgi:Tfp pilus assembly protein PilE
MRNIFTKKEAYHAKFLQGRGFTLIELLIIVGITTILASVSAVVYGNLQVSAQLNEVSAQITQNLRLAREQSLAGLNNVAHGVKLNSNQYVLFQGSSYATRDSTYDRVFSLADALTVTPGLVPSGSEIIFSKGIGLPSATGTITVTHSITGTKGIVINDKGFIREQ